MAERLQVQALDGKWETLGVDRDFGIDPESVNPSWAAYGPDILNFSIKRDPTVEHPDLGAYTPIRWVVDGRTLWLGRTMDAPGSSGEDPMLSVQAQGLWHHLLDDLYSPMYVHHRLADWQDIRSLPGVALGPWSSVAQVTLGGEIVCVWPQTGSTIVDKSMGVVIDCGEDPDAWAAWVNLEFEYVGAVGGGNHGLYVRGFSSPTPNYFNDGVADSNHSDAFSNYTGAAGVLAAAFAQKRRYVAIFLYRIAATFAPLAADEGFRLKKVILQRDGAYAEGDHSVLKATDVLKDIPARYPLISPAVDEIAQTSLAIPHYSFIGQDVAGGELAEQINIYHRYVLKVDHRGKMIFQPQPARATLKVDTGRRGARFADASSNSGLDIYNKVIVRGASGSGVPLKTVRFAGQVPNVPTIIEAAGLQPSNPSAAVDASGWASSSPFFPASTVARDTGTFYTTPASIRIYVPPSTNLTRPTKIVAAFPAGAVFKAGRAYVISFVIAAHRTGGGAISERFIYSFGDVDTAPLITLISGATTGVKIGINSAYIDELASINVTDQWFPKRLLWVPSVDVASANVKLRIDWRTPSAGAADLSDIWVDNVEVSRCVPTVIDRRAFIRAAQLDVQSPTDVVAMVALADAFLALHATAALKGTLEVSADDAVTELLTDRPVPASDLGVKTSEIIHLANLVDPDTGQLGRNAVLAGVSYNGGVATVALDSGRDNFEALLARMGVVQSG